MIKIFAIALFVTFLNAGAASAGGGAEPVPGTNYTDMPPYHPMPACRTKRSCVYSRYHQPAHHYWY